MASQRDIFKCATPKIPTFLIDADGKEIQIETRDDDEQKINYQEIINVLVAAGYFRARIKGLSPFDMVVGGMTWCIDTTEVDIDVDLLFEEGLTIGQKISLTEKIVAVLPKIKCPYFIEPHQIQGLDFIHILPVIQWLVKWSTENRQKKAEYLKLYAINQFHKRYPLSENTASKLSEKNSISCNIQSVILKYGEREPLYNVTGKIQQLQDSNAASTNNKQILEDMGRLERRKKELEDALEKANEELEELEKNKKEEEAEEDDLQKIVNQLSEEEQSNLKKLQELIEEHENLKERKNKFKEECTTELTRLQNEIQELEDEENDNSEIEELQKQLQEVNNQLKLSKLEFGKKTRDILIAERELEQIPSNAELTQYQRRFLELYNQIAVKHKETKQYYTLFNMLTDKYKYLQKEYNLYNSIQDSYAEALSASKRKEFLNQLSNITVGVQQTKLKVMQKTNDERKHKEKLLAQIELFQEKRRQYDAAVKELSMHCQENVRLIKQIELLSNTSSRE